MALDLTQHPCFNSDAGTAPGGFTSRGAQVQYPVQLLQPQVRLREREPSGCDQCRAFAAAGHQLPHHALEAHAALKVVGMPDRAIHSPVPRKRWKHCAGARAVSRDAAVRGQQRLNRSRTSLSSPGFRSAMSPSP